MGFFSITILFLKKFAPQLIIFLFGILITHFIIRIITKSSVLAHFSSTSFFILGTIFFAEKIINMIPSIKSLDDSGNLILKVSKSKEGAEHYSDFSVVKKKDPENQQKKDKSPNLNIGRPKKPPKTKNEKERKENEKKIIDQEIKKLLKKTSFFFKILLSLIIIIIPISILVFMNLASKKIFFSLFTKKGRKHFYRKAQIKLGKIDFRGQILERIENRDVTYISTDLAVNEEGEIYIRHLGQIDQNITLFKLDDFQKKESQKISRRIRLISLIILVLAVITATIIALFAAKSTKKINKKLSFDLPQKKEKKSKKKKKKTIVNPFALPKTEMVDSPIKNEKKKQKVKKNKGGKGEANGKKQTLWKSLVLISYKFYVGLKGGGGPTQHVLYSEESEKKARKEIEEFEEELLEIENISELWN